MKKALVLVLLLGVGICGMAKTNFFEDIYIDDAMTVVGLATFGAVNIVGNFDVNGTTVSLDGSTSVLSISAGYVGTQSDDIRFGLDADDYMMLVTSADTANLAITHPGNTGALVTWTSGGWTLTGAFEIVGTTTLDDVGMTGGLTVAYTTPPDIILDNTTAAGADADSGKFYWRGNDGAADTELDMSIFLDITTTTDYKLSFMSDGAGAEVASIDQGGDAQFDGDLDVDGGEIDVATAATDIVIIAATDAAFEIFDSVTKFIGIDTRISGANNIETIELDPGDVTVPDDAGSTRNGVVIKSATTSAAATTGITTPFDGLSFQVEVPTLVGFGAGTIVSEASTMFIAGPPTAGADMTITVGYALEVDAGTTMLGGNLEFDGALDVVVDANTASALDFSVATTPFLTFNTQNTTDEMSNFTFTGIPTSVTAAANSYKRTVAITPGTTTLDTVTGTDDMDGMALYISQPIITNDDAGTVAKASTVLIAAEPVAADAAVITAAYALEIASGDTLLAGDIYVVGGEIDVAAGATDVVIVANTDMAFEISDGITKFIGIDTQNTASLVETIELNAGAGTIPDAGGSTRNGVVVKSATTTMAGTTQITTPFDGLALQVEVPTITRVGAATVDQASTVYIAGVPISGGDVTITAPYALEVEAGTSLLGGNLKFDGALDIVVDANTAAALDFSVVATPFLTFNTQNTTDQISNVTFTGIPSSFTAGASSTKRTVTITPGTTTLDVANATTNMSGMGLYVDQPTITNDDIGTVAQASTVYIVGEPVVADAALITAPYSLEIASGDILLAGDIDLANGESLGNAGDGVVTVTGDDETGIDLQVVSMAHDTTGDASLTLDADAGGDNDDTWILKSVANGNAFNIIQHATTEFSIDASGNATVTGDVTVSGGDIIDGSGGGVAVTNKGTSIETMGGAQKTVITFTLTGDHDIDTADGGKSAGIQVYDFPDGYIQILGALIDASVVTNAVYNADAADQYHISVGTVDGTQAADVDLTATEADIIAKTTHDTDGGGGANTQLTNEWHAQDLTVETFDGTTTAVNLFVNVAVPDANNTGATTHAITGTLTIFWINHGDY